MALTFCFKIIGLLAKNPDKFDIVVCKSCGFLVKTFSDTTFIKFWTSRKKDGHIQHS